MPEKLLFTSNNSWLEAIDERRAQSPEELLSDLEDLLDDGEITEFQLINYIKRETRMSKNNRTTTLSLALAAAKDPAKAKLRTPRVKPEQTPPPPRPLLTNTSIAYLGAAMDKLCDAPHPNFLAKIKTDTKLVYATIREAACKAYDASPADPKAAVMGLIRSLKTTDRAFIQALKDLNGNCAFNAHMDCVRLTRKLDIEQLNQGLDAMGDSHDNIDNTDVPAHDVGDAARGYDRDTGFDTNEREAYAGGPADEPQPIASSVDDAYAAINGVQAWLGLAVSGMTVEQRQYWGVDGHLPFGQRMDVVDGEKVYTGLSDFDDYREYQTESYKRKLRTVPLGADLEDLMSNG